MNRTSIIRATLTAQISFAALLGSQAYAQTAQAAQTTGEEGVGEIIVTAQKRSQNLQDVPVAITALTAADIAAAGVTGTADLRAAVPALNLTTGTGGFGLPRIRGIGATGQGPGIENPVVVYVDGVYYASAFGVLQSLFDTQQVAVLKGPQGTLFGRNATGGLIQISTMEPTDKFTVKAQIGVGNYKTMSGGGFVSAPITDTLAISASGQFETRDTGYGRNLFTGRDIQDGETWSARVKLRWDMTPDTTLNLSGDFNGRNASEPAFRNFGLNTLGQNVTTQITILMSIRH
jgi:iron complex outermembrane recepter protein